MKTLHRNIFIGLTVLLTSFTFSSCVWDNYYNDSFYCNDVEIILTNNSGRTIYFSLDETNYCDQILLRNESLSLSYGRMDVDPSYPQVIYIYYDYRFGISNARPVEVVIDDCVKEILLW
jgi:hypothetical protein